MRAAGVEAADRGVDPGDTSPTPEDVARGPASARLVAVDMAHEGSTRDEVEAYLRDELEIDDTGAILDEVFDPSGEPQPDLPVEEASGAARLSRLFARNRS